MPHAIGLLEYSIAIIVLIILGSYFYFRKPAKKDQEQSDQSTLAPYKVEPPTEAVVVKPEIAPVTPVAVVNSESTSNATLGNNTVSVVQPTNKPKVVRTKKPVQKTEKKPATTSATKSTTKTATKPKTPRVSKTTKVK